jgi:hypothetical protein
MTEARPQGSARGARIVAMTTDLATADATQPQIAAQLGCAQSQVSIALTVLRYAP